MKISVIVPAYNEERLIGKTLGQLRQAMTAFTQVGWDSELIVCDNNSTDRTAELARAGQAKVVFEPINQISRARNTGAAVASGDWLVFVDADSEPSAALLAEVVEQIQAGRCLAGGCTVRLETDHQVGRSVVVLWNWLSRRFKLLAGSFIFCEANAFREIGGFNQELYASEELDLTKRLKQLARKRGQRIVILHRNSLLTSARKVHLYTLREYVWFLFTTAATFGGTLKRRESCQPWYDGRR
jgi:glycosyltransferase involved in cell wall biosynthesis